MPQSIINTKNPNQADVVLLGANYDKTSSFGKGADKGPAAIVNCLDTQIEFYDRFTRNEPVSRLRISYKDLGNLNALAPEKMVDIIAREFKRYYSENKFVFLIGGEHSVSNGSFRALSEIENPKEVTIVQIDAHADMRENDADYNDKPWGKYAHGSVMRRAHELGFHIVQVGLRAYSKDEHNYVSQQKNITWWEWGIGKIPSIETILRSIKTKKVYLTIDIDGIDPSHTPATGTPVQGGLEWYYTLRFITHLFEKRNVLACDVVEVSPQPHSNLTEYGAAQLIYNGISRIKY